MRQLIDAAKVLSAEPEYWSMLGDAFQRLADHPLAVGAYVEALARDPRRFSDTLNAARSAEAAGQASQAIEFYEQSLELEPKSSVLKAEVAEFFGGIGAPERGLPLIRAAIRQDPGRAEWWVTLAELIGEDDRLRSEEALERATQLALAAELPDYDLLRRLGEQLRQAERYDDAREVLAVVLLESPRDPETNFTLAKIAEAQGDLAEAIRRYDIVAELKESEFAEEATERAAELRQG